MKKILYIIIIGLSFLAPLERADVAMLEPIEAVALSKNNDQVTLMTDTGNQGSGKNAQEALSDLKMNTPGIVYLDTAKYLLVSETAVDEIEALRNDLKGTVRICLWNEGEDVQNAVEYLKIHDDFPLLRSWHHGMKLPVYVIKNNPEIRKFVLTK